MSAGPTNRQTLVAPLELDPEQAIRQTAQAQGCICGDALRVEERSLTPAERRSAPPAARKTGWDLRHLDGCPLLRRIEGRN